MMYGCWASVSGKSVIRHTSIILLKETPLRIDFLMRII
nr:MAG TPA: hypothetical protein [Caudoviricetes sp.]